MLIDKGKAIFSNYGVRLWKGILQRIYRFDKWHIVSLRQRKYARDIISWCNRRNVRRTFVEIGCGLGDIVRNVAYDNATGYDSDPRVLEAAALMGRLRMRRNLRFLVGLFPDITLSGPYDVLVMVNWVHHIEPPVLRSRLGEYFNTLLYPGGAILIDTVAHPEYRYNHDIGYLTGDLPQAEIEKIGDYERGRSIWAIKKRGV